MLIIISHRKKANQNHNSAAFHTQPGRGGVERQALRQAMRSAAQLGSPGWDLGLGSDRDAGAAVEAQLCPGTPGSDLHCIPA